MIHENFIAPPTNQKSPNRYSNSTPSQAAHFVIEEVQNIFPDEVSNLERNEGSPQIRVQSQELVSNNIETEVVRYEDKVFHFHNYCTNFTININQKLTVLLNL